MTDDRRPWWALRFGLAVGDTAALLGSVWLATDLRYGPAASLVAGPHPLVGLALVPTFLVLFLLQHLYDEEYLLGGTQEYARAVTACAYGVLATLVLSFFVGGSPLVSRAWLVFYCLFSVATVCLWRFTARRLLHRIHARGGLVTRLVIAGASDQGVAIAEQLDAPPSRGNEVVGFVDDYLPLGTLVTTVYRPAPHDLPVLGDPGALPRIAREYGVREVIVVPQALSWESLETIVREVALGKRQYRVRLAPGLYDVLATGVRPTPRANVPLLALDQARITGVDRLLKGALDRFASAAALLALVPLLGLLVLGGKLCHRRPLFERRAILGLAGRPHTVWFFGPWLAHHRLLRGLPSLVAVLRGHLSLVGPRPQVAAGAAPSALDGLLVVKPGLTGPWRLAPRAAVQPPWYNDVWYLRNYSIWEDLRILYQTFWRLGRPPGAGAGALSGWQPDGTADPTGGGAAAERLPALVTR